MSMRPVRLSTRATPLSRLAVAAHHEHRVALRIARDGLLGQQHGAGELRLRHAHAHVHAGQQLRARVRHLRAQRHLAGRRIHRQLGEQQPARLRQRAPVVAEDLHRHAVGQLRLPCGSQAPAVEVAAAARGAHAPSRGVRTR
jgi:hypothetical protein